MPELRPFHPGDEQGICGLFAACHGRDLPLELRRWRYAPQDGRNPVIDVASDNGRIVAHLATLPVFLRRGEERLEAGLWVDLMVHPDFRNLSLFLEMAGENQRRSAEAGMRVLFAFPNDRSYPVLKRMLEWNSVEEIDALEAPLAKIPTRASAGALRISGFGREHEELWRRLSPPEALTPERSSAWLNWRYRERPGRTYPAWETRGAGGRLSGWLTTHIFDGPQGRVGDILDLCAEPGAEEALWSAALDHFRASEVETVSAWALKESPLFAQFTRWGLLPCGPRTHFAGRWASSGELPAFPAHGRDWRISKGDSDVF